MDGAGPDAAHGQAGDRPLRGPLRGSCPQPAHSPLGQAASRIAHSPWDNAAEERFAHLLGCPNRPPPTAPMTTSPQPTSGPSALDMPRSADPSLPQEP